MNVYILKILVYLQIAFDVNLNFIEQFGFLEIFCYFGGINLSEKCVNVSCCIVLVSSMSKIRAFYWGMLYSERIVTSMAEVGSLIKRLSPSRAYKIRIEY